jgi:hypothetical protein
LVIVFSNCAIIGSIKLKLTASLVGKCLLQGNKEQEAYIEGESAAKGILHAMIGRQSTVFILHKPRLTTRILSKLELGLSTTFVITKGVSGLMDSPSRIVVVHTGSMELQQGSLRGWRKGESGC